jgi:hypothetical protein
LLNELIFGINVGSLALAHDDNGEAVRVREFDGQAASAR